MALTSTLRRFTVEVADIDRHVYETLDLRIAQHPSESDERVVIRVLARALAHEEDLEFGRGLSHREDPALVRRTAHGIATWIEVGAPSADLLHRASKAADRVAVFTDKPLANLVREWSSRNVHRADELEVVQLPPTFVSSLVDTLARTTRWWLTLQEGSLSVTNGDTERACELRRGSLQSLLDS